MGETQLSWTPAADVLLHWSNHSPFQGRRKHLGEKDWATGRRANGQFWVGRSERNRASSLFRQGAWAMCPGGHTPGRHWANAGRQL